MKSFALLIVLISAFIVPLNQTPFTPIAEFSGNVADAHTGETLVGVSIWIEELGIGTATNLSGRFSIQVEPGTYDISFAYVGYEKLILEVEIPSSGLTNQQINMKPEINLLEELVIVAEDKIQIGKRASPQVSQESDFFMALEAPVPREVATSVLQGTEEYDEIIENEFQIVQSNPLSTFSIDVDGASYSNVRRMIMDGFLPPTDAVRIEELINYFNYNYAEPTDGHPFAVHSESAQAPWNHEHQIVQIGIKGEEIDKSEMLPNNLVLLLDVSGSMDMPDKLPLLKKGLRLLVNELGEEDYVSIVVYAGSSGLVLPPTSGFNKEKILTSIDNLYASGSTAGAAGIKLAYETAKQNFRTNANNRVILATDGDFNVGVSNDKELVELIEEKRDDGIFLSVLGFGTGNLKDSKMEKIANHGNGNYYYIDNLLEAKKVLITEMGGTLHTIAKDVKIQVEFNPSHVQAYRLIGYENRVLEHHEFNDDKKDAGELGSGHTVTALYEVVPVGVEFSPNGNDVDPLKYQDIQSSEQATSNELMTVKFRYKLPDEDQSTLISKVISKTDSDLEMSSNLYFSTSVAAFGMLLRDSEHKGSATFQMVKELAKKGIGNDENGYRAEFLRIAELTELIYQGNSKRD